MHVWLVGKMEDLFEYFGELKYEQIFILNMNENCLIMGIEKAKGRVRFCHHRTLR